jgi:tRNA(Arg) A34 adenosine deaminase TadA
MSDINDSKQLTLSRVSNWALTQWMKVALEEGKSGVGRGENPFAAAIYRPDGKIIAVRCNTANSTTNPSAHAEVNAIATACQSLGRKDLGDYWLLATAEPCVMCLSCAAMAGIKHIAFGASDAVVREAGYGGIGISGRELASQLSVEITLRGSILGNECASFLLSNRKRYRNG